MGLVEQKFYQIAANINALFEKVQNKKYKGLCYDLIKYIYNSERHSRYLDSVRHPAKRARNSEFQKEFFVQTGDKNVDN